MPAVQTRYELVKNSEGTLDIVSVKTETERQEPVDYPINESAPPSEPELSRFFPAYNPHLPEHHKNTSHSPDPVFYVDTKRNINASFDDIAKNGLYTEELWVCFTGPTGHKLNVRASPEHIARWPKEYNEFEAKRQADEWRRQVDRMAASSKRKTEEQLVEMRKAGQVPTIQDDPNFDAQTAFINSRSPQAHKATHILKENDDGTLDIVKAQASKDA